MSRLVFTAIGLTSVVATACAPSGESATRGEGEPSVAPEGGNSDPPSAAEAGDEVSDEMFVGRWRMVSEEAPAGQKGVAKQGRKLLELRQDGTFESQNYIERREGAWSRDADVLTLEGIRVRVLEVEPEALVLVEDVPEIYLRDGPPQQVKMTYRRVSEAEFGPMLGRDVKTTRPKAGLFAAAYAYSMSKYPTMEIHVGRHVKGLAEMELRVDGRARGCFGVVVGRSGSRSKYASKDGKHHSNRSEERSLIAWSGTWVAAKNEVKVSAERMWQDTCDDVSDAPQFHGSLELECQALVANEALPTASLACLLVAGPSALRDIAINPADTERSGPFTMQSDPMGHISTDQGRPWILLGRREREGRGLIVDSKDGRDEQTPVVTFEAGNVVMRESDYRREADPD